MKAAVITLGIFILAALASKSSSINGRTKLHYSRPTENFFYVLIVNTNAVRRTIRDLNRQGYKITYKKRL